MAEKRTDNRGHWTIKHSDVGPEFQSLVRMAASRHGMTVGSFVVETLRERATNILKGEEGTPHGTPPARLEDLADVLSNRFTEMAAAQTEALERLRQEQVEAMTRIERELADRRFQEQRSARRSRRLK